MAISTRLAGQEPVIQGAWALEVPREDKAPSLREESRAQGKTKMEGRKIAVAGVSLVHRQAVRGLTQKIAAGVQTSIRAHRGKIIRAREWIAQIPPALDRAEMKNAAAIVVAGSASLRLRPASAMKGQWLEGGIVPTIGQTIGLIVPTIDLIGPMTGRANRRSN